MAGTCTKCFNEWPDDQVTRARQDAPEHALLCRNCRRELTQWAGWMSFYGLQVDPAASGDGQTPQTPQKSGSTASKQDA